MEGANHAARGVKAKGFLKISQVCSHFQTTYAVLCFHWGLTTGKGLGYSMT